MICDYLHGNKVELPADKSQQMTVLTEKMNDGVVYIYVYIVASDNLFVKGFASSQIWPCLCHKNSPVAEI